MQEKEAQLISDLYQEQFDAMLIYALNVLRDEARAQEAVQSTFLEACKKPKALYSSPNPQGWLFLTLQNTIRNMERSRRRLARFLMRLPYLGMLHDRPADDMPELGLDVLYGDLAECRQYGLLKKFIVEKCTLAELSEEYNISIGACKQRIYRGKKELRKIMEQHMDKHK